MSILSIVSSASALWLAVVLLTGGVECVSSNCYIVYNTANLVWLSVVLYPGTVSNAVDSWFLGVQQNHSASSLHLQRGGPLVSDNIKAKLLTFWIEAAGIL